MFRSLLYHKMFVNFRCRMYCIYNHCRLRHFGWEKCGRGLTSRPQETAGMTFLDEIPVLFRYPPRSALALLEGTLPLKYCAVKFAGRMPDCPLLVGLLVLSLMVVKEVGMVRVEPCVRAGAPCLHDGIGVDWLRGHGGGEKLQHSMCGRVFWCLNLAFMYGRD